ncbi:hypothetical protein [Streptomyces sp. TRM70350]|nr:hypothetical protein [Streptomyces sp. TRM70350]MBV7697445.1 hypothetical protein [Streptomyces sp. TRM70350]
MANEEAREGLGARIDWLVMFGPLSAGALGLALKGYIAGTSAISGWSPSA